MYSFQVMSTLLGKSSLACTADDDCIKSDIDTMRSQFSTVVVSSSSCIASLIICNVSGNSFKTMPDSAFLAIVPRSVKYLRKRWIDCFETTVASSKAKMLAIFDTLISCQCKLRICNFVQSLKNILNNAADTKKAHRAAGDIVEWSLLYSLNLTTLE